MARHLSSRGVRGGSRGRRGHRKLWSGVLMIVLVGILTPPAVADHGGPGPNVTATPNVDLTPGQEIIVAGSSFTPGAEVSVTQCHISLRVCVFGSVPPTTVGEDGTFSQPFNVGCGEGPPSCSDPGWYVAALTEDANEGDQADISFASSENQPPVAVDDGASTTQNNSVSIEVLANDSDPDEDQLSISNLSQPENGTAEIQQNGVPYVLYTPNEGFTGIDTFTYTANDGELDSNVVTVTVTVTSSENQPPVANDDQAFTAENTSVNIDVLANDSDPDEDTVFVSDVSQPENGSTFINKDQTVAYTPNEGFTGVDTFTYTASDFESSDTATVMVLVGDDGDSCEVETSEGCTATTDSGVTGPGNPVSVTMTVPPGQPAGVYAVREIDQTVPKPAGAFEYIAPEGATEIFIEVSCDESQCPRLRNRKLDLQLTVIKENEDGTVKTLPPCVEGRRGQIVNPPPCVFSVIRDTPGSGDLIWTVKVLGGDPKAGGAR